MKTIVRVLSWVSFLAATATAQELQFANLGDFKLQSGEVIRDCHIGYRTFGKLKSGPSNVILFTTWFGGTTQDLIEMIGPEGLDPGKYFVIAVDAIGDGVSTSPSNSKSQPRMKFPKFTIADMVNSQHQLLTEVLHINHIKAVTGISMGGMQTFQWMVSYPDFMDKAIPIVGSPRLAAYDLVFWEAENEAIKNDPNWKNGEYTEQPARRILAAFEQLMLTTPLHFNTLTPREKVNETVTQAENTFDAANHIRQSEAMMTLDVSAPFGGSMTRAAASVKTKPFVIVNDMDHMVTPGPALEFAALMNSQVLKLQDDCGHVLFQCESDRIVNAMIQFLDK